MDKMANDLDQKWRDALRYQKKKRSFMSASQQFPLCVLFQFVFLAFLCLAFIRVTYITNVAAAVMDSNLCKEAMKT